MLDSMIDRSTDHEMETEALRVPLRIFAVATIRRELVAHPEGIPVVDLFETVRSAVAVEFGYDLYTWDDFDNHMRIISVSGKMVRLLREVG